jgi:hypothetical protein
VNAKQIEENTDQNVSDEWRVWDTRDLSAHDPFLCAQEATEYGLSHRKLEKF